MERAAKVSHSEIRPVSYPRLNQLTRCCEVPWVNDSGTTHPSLRLQSIVTDSAGSVESFLNIARLDYYVWERLDSVRPDPCEAVGLELLADREGVPFGFAERSAGPPDRRAGSLRDGDGGSERPQRSALDDARGLDRALHGEPASRTGVPGNEWFVREEDRFYAPAPVTVTEPDHALEVYTDDFLGGSIRVPTLYERANVRAYVSLSQVYRGADLLTMPGLEALGELVTAGAEGLVGDTEIERATYADLDVTAVEGLVSITPLILGLLAGAEAQ